MDIVQAIKLFLSTSVVMIAFDALWLAKISPKLYKTNIGHLMADKPNMLAAGIFYVLYIIGLIILVILPAHEKQSALQALAKGALFGAVAYGTFDLTSNAVFKDWPAKITVIDLVWGTILTAATCSASYYIYSHYIA